MQVPKRNTKATPGKRARRTQEQRRALTQAALLKAARKLFVNQGFAATSTPDIVAAAEVTRGALYHHYADKTDLFRAVIEAEAQAVALAIDEPTRDPVDALDALLTGSRAYLETMKKPGRARLLLVEGPAVLGREVMHEIDQRTGGESLRQGLLFAMRAGELEPLPAGPLADVLSAAFDRAALAIASGEPSAPYEQVLEAIMRRILS